MSQIIPFHPSKMDTDTSIQSMFDGLSGQYDRFNRYVSLGMDRSWRKYTVRDLRPGMRVLDVGAGTGDLCFEAIGQMRGKGEVVGLDFSRDMLVLAKEKARRLGRGSAVRWVERSATEIPFEDEPYDMVISGFVLRNIYQDIDRIVSGVFRALKPGGGIRFLDLTEPDQAWVRTANHWYFNTAVRFWGRAIFKDSYPVEYLENSISRFLTAKEFKTKLESHGFEDVRLKRFLFGTVTVYSAARPDKL